ncbi:MAG: dockerin type I repeat-containing protein [Prevotella sp.]|nr:dockerin type I repeat-containing protein [Prevotella sp.]
MNRLLLTIMAVLAFTASWADDKVDSPTEGVITSDFVTEESMKHDLLQMLANFAVYMKKDFQDCVAPNSVGEACGCFKGENTMANDERGVRPNADLSMICAFLVKYGKKVVTLPSGVTWDDLEAMAKKSLVFAYSTHKANKLKVCAGNTYWGSVSTKDYVWESSLWAMSVAYSAFFQWDKLSKTQRGYIYELLKAECNYELNRNIPTGYAGDTKAEENGWEADILAATLGLFPNDELAPRWFQRLREFAINSYSQKDDATDNTIIDPDYDQKTVKDLYKGQNLYDDYTLQNHNYFHTSYQNVVIQELGEAALALKLFQQGLYGVEKWKTNALMHNNQKVMEEVLYWLALADGELAMPNGNDWSLFLYDQITSYSTNACFLRDKRALLLENLAYKMIKARQTTTTDGSWLLRPDVGARRMGVEAHRVMMTWLMHEILSTADLTPTPWDDFNREYSAAKVLPSQNIVRAATDSRFTCFSWSTGLKSYTGYIAANNVDKNKIIVPFRANNTGNFLGWYEVSGKKTNATPVVSGIYNLQGNAYTMNGELNTNDATLNNRFVIYSTPGNAVVYLDYVRANADATITAEKGGLMAISVDELTKTERTLYNADGQKQADGTNQTTMNGPWVNIDDALGIVNLDKNKQIAFDEKANNNSIMTAKLYTSYSTKSRPVQKGSIVDRRAIVYYSNIDAEGTKNLSMLNTQLETQEGWNGAIVFDPDQTGYLLLSNFASDQKCQITGVTTQLGHPVFTAATTISSKGSSAIFGVEENHSVANTLRFFIKGGGLQAVQALEEPTVIYLLNLEKGNNKLTVNAVDNGKQLSKDVTLSTKVLKVSIVGGELLVEEANGFPDSAESPQTKGYRDVTSAYLKNANFEEDKTYGEVNPNGLTIESVTYKPCYENTVSPINSKWPNILPVTGWTPANGLSDGSNYCRMYSMPYSSDIYCVSPSKVGNYAARCSKPLIDDGCGDRVLTVLNSWDMGSNTITQGVSLYPGKYRLMLDMRYECPNQISNDGEVIVTTGNNFNTSLTGVKTKAGNDFRYPSEPNAWQQLCYDLNMGSKETVTVSLGFSTSAKQGAANNTLLYIDNLRLYVLNGDADGNGRVDGKDLDTLVNHIIDPKAALSNPDAADLNGDSLIDIADVASLISILQQAL